MYRVVAILYLEATSYTRHSTFRTMLRSATPELRHTEMCGTGPAPYWNAPYRNSATLDLRRTGAKLDLRHSGLRHSVMTPNSDHNDYEISSRDTVLHLKLDPVQCSINYRFRLERNMRRHYYFLCESQQLHTRHCPTKSLSACFPC